MLFTMLERIALVVTAVAVFLASSATSLDCVPRASDQYIQDPSFESPDDVEWGYGGAFIGSSPTYPARTGNNAIVAKASYVKNSTSEAIITRSFIQQFISPARTSWTSQIRLYYRVLSLSKGSTCPDSTLPQIPCKLRVSYVDQTIGTISLYQSSNYIEFNGQFVPESSARYLSLNLDCKPTSTTSTDGCADVTVVVDDVTWTDPGHVCWTPLGCYTDQVSARTLPAHGLLPSWPYTTTIQSCQEACGRQGYSLAGLEFGQECFCGNAIGSGSVAAPASECNMPCLGDGRQLCGGPDRVDIYQKP